MDLLTTIAGSLMEGFLPAGWDLKKIDACVDPDPTTLTRRQSWWHPRFEPVVCQSLADFETFLGHEIASTIKRSRDAGEKLILILPVGPMGMYRWVVYFLNEWGVRLRSRPRLQHGRMERRGQGRSLPANDPGCVRARDGSGVLRSAGRSSPSRRSSGTLRPRACCRTTPSRSVQLRDQGAKLAVIFGIGRVCHIAFWEPHFAAEFASDAEWKRQTHRLGAKLHPLTIEQNALTSFKSRTTLVPAFANTIGPAVFLAADKIIGGCDGTLGRGMMWQGLSVWMTLRHEPTPWIPSTYMPTQPGRLFILQELAGPLVAECN